MAEKHHEKPVTTPCVGTDIGLRNLPNTKHEFKLSVTYYFQIHNCHIFVSYITNQCKTLFLCQRTKQTLITLKPLFFAIIIQNHTCTTNSAHRTEPLLVVFQNFWILQNIKDEINYCKHKTEIFIHEYTHSALLTELCCATQVFSVTPVHFDSQVSFHKSYVLKTIGILTITYQKGT